MEESTEETLLPSVAVETNSSVRIIPATSVLKEKSDERKETLLPQDNLEENSKTRCGALLLVDVVLVLTIVVWCTVGCWRSGFTLLQLYSPTPMIVLFLLGSLVELLFVFLRETLGRIFTAKYIFFRVGYVYVYFWGIVGHWVGVWSLLDGVLGMDSAVNIIGTSAVMVLLLLFGYSRNILAPPYVGGVDSSPLLPHFPTAFRTRVGSVSSHFVHSDLQ